MRFHLDYALHREDLRELGDGFAMRRAWAGINGKLYSDWNYQFLFSLGESGQVSPIALYLRYTGWNIGHVTIGHMKQPYGLEWLMSSNNLPMIERALPISTLSNAFNLGLTFSIHRDMWSLSLTGFGPGAGAATRTSDGDEGLGIGGRFTTTPVRTDNSLIHFGIAAHREGPADKTSRTIHFSTRPESSPSTIRLVETDQITEVNHINRLGFETTLLRGPLSLQTEWMYTGAERGSDLADVDFSGWYVTGSYFLTGESRSYRNGVFGGIAPKGIYGAFELTARYSTINLNDGTITGGEQSNVTIGFNWYANNRVRFMFNYINVTSEREGISDNPHIFLARTQMAI